MPFYVGDYLGDTQRLTTEQHGAYLLLILDYWRNGPAPDDDAVLQQITKLERAAWKRHRPALARMFQIEDGQWRHKRIDRELEAAAANAERRSSKAKKAAEARWGNTDAQPEQPSRDTASNAPSMPDAMLGECPPPSPSPSPNGDTVVDDACARLDVGAATAELCRVAGIRHLEPGHIIRHQELVRGWIEEGFDFDLHVMPAVRQAIADTDERISSLKFFDRSIRQHRARLEAHANGHAPRRKSVSGFGSTVDAALAFIADGEPH